MFITHDVDEAVLLADRLIVLRGKPAAVGLDIVSPLPKERDQITTKELPAFLELRHTIYEMLRGHGSRA
jgi:NitT/TauT family transport system ATP-binding protein